VCLRPQDFTPIDGGLLMATISAEPFDLDFDPATTALVIIDMQRDFVLPGWVSDSDRMIAAIS
jgi:hypothetical protein